MEKINPFTPEEQKTFIELTKKQLGEEGKLTKEELERIAELHKKMTSGEKQKSKLMEEQKAELRELRKKQYEGNFTPEEQKRLVDLQNLE